MAKILLLEDDQVIAESVSAALCENHSVEVCGNGGDGWQLLQASKFDLIVIDWGLPEITGVEIARRLRANGNDTPILMLTARSHIDDKEKAFNVGADDYLSKPFHMKELLLRVRSLLSRSRQRASAHVLYKSLTIDFDKHEATLSGSPLKLLPLEFALLELLMKNPGTVFKSSEILQRVWHSEADPTPGGLRQCVYRLKNKLGDECSGLIENVHGVGYRFAPEDCA
jgi:DNA-binding response OmpR family regulator